MVRTPRKLAAWMAALAALAALAQAFTGANELALYLTPFLLVVTLLLGGRFLGEERIVRRREIPVAARARRTRPRWAHPADLPLASLLARSPVRRRGPPRLAALAG